MNIYLEYSYNWWLIQCRLHWMSVGNLLACLGLGILFSRDGYTHIYLLQDIATFTIFLYNIPTIGGLCNAMLPTDRQCDLYCNLGHIGSLLATYWHAWTWDYYWQECRRAGAGNMARCLSFGSWTCLSIIPYLPIHINCHYDIFLNIMNTFLIHSSSWWLISYFA